MAAVLAIPIVLLLGLFYIILGGMLINLLKVVYTVLTSKDFFLYTALGDISWLFPFKPNELDFRFTNLLLVCIMLVLISGLVLGFSYIRQWQEAESRKNQLLVELLAKQSAQNVNKQDAPVSENAAEAEKAAPKESTKPSESRKNK